MNHEQTIKDLMDELVTARKEGKITQTDMTEKFGARDRNMSQGDFSRMERRDNMLLSNLVLWADCLGYDVRLVRR